MLSTAWPWPYAPEGLPKLTVQMNRADPFNHVRRLRRRARRRARGRASSTRSTTSGTATPSPCSASYLASNGTEGRAARAPSSSQLLKEEEADANLRNEALDGGRARSSPPAAWRSPPSRHRRSTRRAAPAPRTATSSSACATARRPLEVKGVKDGEQLTRAQAQQVSDELMDEWRKKNPNATRRAQLGSRRACLAAEPAGAGVPAPQPRAAVRRRAPRHGDSRANVPGAGAQRDARTGHTYGAFSDARRADLEPSRRRPSSRRATGSSTTRRRWAAPSRCRATCATRTRRTRTRRRTRSTRCSSDAWRCCAT